MTDKPLKALLGDWDKTLVGDYAVTHDLGTEMARRLRKLDEWHSEFIDEESGPAGYCAGCECECPCPDRRVLDGGSGD